MTLRHWIRLTYRPSDDNKLGEVIDALVIAKTPDEAVKRGKERYRADKVQYIEGGEPLP